MTHSMSNPIDIKLFDFDTPLNRISSISKIEYPSIYFDFCHFCFDYQTHSSIQTFTYQIATTCPLFQQISIDIKRTSKSNHLPIRFQTTEPSNRVQTRTYSISSLRSTGLHYKWREFNQISFYRSSTPNFQFPVHVRFQEILKSKSVSCSMSIYTKWYQLKSTLIYN